MHARGRRTALAVTTATALAACAAYALATAADARAQAPGADGRIHFTVDDERDLPDARPGDGTCASPAPDGRCTLRAAFDEAGASGQPTTIALPAGLYTLNLNRGAAPPVAGPAYAGLYVPSGADVRLEGAGAAVTVIRLGLALSETRMIIVAESARLDVTGATLRAAGAHSAIQTYGRLTVADAVLSGCSPCTSVVSVDFDGTLAMTRTVVADNKVDTVLFLWGSAVVVSSTFQHNVVASQVLYAYGAARFEASAIIGNEFAMLTSWGGGGGHVQLHHSTVADNVIRLWDFGGAPMFGSGPLTLEHTTIAGNRATAERGPMVLFRSDRLAITASIVADNGTLGDVYIPSAGCIVPTIVSHGDSVVDQSSCADPARGDRVVADADLGPLVDAGGPTPVRLPRPSSAAIGARTVGCPAVDARGAPRPAGGPCAAGAAEPSSPPPPRGLLWPIEAAFPTGGPDAPQRTEGVPGPPTVLAVRDGRGIVVRGRQGQALGITNQPTALEGGMIDLPSPAIDAALDGTTAWLMHADGTLTSVDVTDRARPVRLAVVHHPVPGDLTYPVAYTRLAIPAPGVLWRLGWTGKGLRGTPVQYVDVWDVTRPTTPRHLQKLDIGFGAGPRGLAWYAGRLVIAQATGLGFGKTDRSFTVLDASAPLTPAEGARLDLDGTPTGVTLHHHHAFVTVRQRDGGAPDGVLAIEVTDAAKPVVLGWWPDVWDDVVAAPNGVLLRRGASLAAADLSDPLRPRILSAATWLVPPTSLRATDTDILARLADGRDVVVDLTAPGGPRPVDAPSDGVVIQTTVGGGEDLAWRTERATWHVADPQHPARVRRELPEAGATTVATPTVADGIVWKAAPDGIHGFATDGTGDAVGTIDVRNPAALSAANARLWVLTGSHVALWDVADPARPTPSRTWPLPTDAIVGGLAADDAGAVVWSSTGRVWRLRIDDSSTQLPGPLVVHTAGPIVAAAIVGDRLAIIDGTSVTAYAIDSGSASLLGALLVSGAGRGLAASGDRAYVVAGGWLHVVGLSSDPVRPVVKVPAPGARGPIAIAGGRAFAAAGANGLLAYDIAAPQPPTVQMHCGTTLPGERDVVVRSPGATSVVLRLDGLPVASAAPAIAGDRADLVTLHLALPAGRHRIDAVALRPNAPTRTSPPIRVEAIPDLLFDPSGVTFDDGRPSGPRPALDSTGCATSADGWTVRIDAHNAIHVVVPIRPDIAATAAVTMTVAGRAARLAPVLDTPSHFAGTLPAITNPAADPIVHLRISAGTERATWHGRAVRQQVWLPWAAR